MKPEDEQKVAPRKGQDLIVVVFINQVRPGILENGIGLDQVEHVPVKGGQLAIFQIGMIRQVPLAPGEAIRPVVALPGKIDPLGVAEFVAHKGQVAWPAVARVISRIILCRAMARSMVLSRSSRCM